MCAPLQSIKVTGENVRRQRLPQKALAGHNVISMCNIYFPWPDGRIVQVDQIIIADRGIYVLEVKNYKG